MQVLKQPTPQVKDVETLQLSANGPLPKRSLSDLFVNGSRPGTLQEPSAIVNVGLELRKKYSLINQIAENSQGNRVRAFFAAALLIAVPVFIQAPLVRVAPTLSFFITGLWLWLGYRWLKKPHLSLWGDLIVGFSWTWLAGTIYWGWFRADPYIHLPIESIGLPFVLTLMRYGKANVGNYFYLGSLLGTAITDLYFYCVGLIPYWRQLMISDPSNAGVILHSALLRMGTYEGVGYAIVLLSLLVMLGTIPIRSRSVRWWAFSGAILSTILVDSLFFIAAILA
ncbi:MAG: DUF3120 domain-containing protein [Cyanobacteria bacterium P01_F01_bin.53]